MTKEELEKEAEEWLCNNLHSASEEDFIKAMVDIAEPREKRIAELEKELKLWNDTTDARLTLYFQQKQKIADLENENAELKEWQKDTIKARGNDYMNWSRMKDQLTKAKVLLKEALDKIDCVEHSSWWDKAEKFLKESE